MFDLGVIVCSSDLDGREWGSGNLEQKLVLKMNTEIIMFDCDRYEGGRKSQMSLQCVQEQSWQWFDIMHKTCQKWIHKWYGDVKGSFYKQAHRCLQKL